MTARPRPGTVFSSELRRVCPRCGWPVADCRCAQTREDAVPALPTARLRVERAGRKGKTVTVIDGLPRNAAFLKELAAQLKRACGSGGTVGETWVEIQGDHCATLRELLRAKGWVVKG